MATKKDLTKKKDGSDYEKIKLDNQLCFSLYVCSKEIIRLYKPLLDPHGLTYTAYIIMMALWEQDQITVKELGKRLYLDSGTLTPMLKKMETLGFIERQRSVKDERNVFISLTKKGHDFKDIALDFPDNMLCTLNMHSDNAQQLVDSLQNMMGRLNN